MSSNIFKVLLHSIFILAIVTVIGCTANKQPNAAIHLVVVTSQNCESCTSTEDVVQFVASRFPDIEVKQVDIKTPEGARYVSYYQLWRVPVYLFLDAKGKEIYRLEGEQTREQLAEAVALLKELKSKE